MDMEMNTTAGDTLQTSPPPPYPTEQQEQQQTPSVKPYPVQTEVAHYPSNGAASAYPQQTQPTNPQTTFNSVWSTQQQPNTRKPSRYANPYSYLLPISIANSVICCFCFGAVAVYYSKKVNDNWAYGNIEEAESNATKAKVWNGVTTVVGFLAVAGYITLIVFEVMARLNNPSL